MAEKPAGTGKGDEAPTGDLKARVLASAVRIVAEQGAEAATTRAIATAAGTQTPTISRLFGDKQGLMDAVAEQTLHDFVATKGRGGPGPDPVEDLKRGMIAFMTFGVSNPDVFAHMYARPGQQSKAASIGYAALCARVHAVALTGRLRTTEESACAIFHGLARGTVLIMLEHPPAEHEAMMEAAGRAAVDAVIAQAAPNVDAGVGGIAAALKAQLGDVAQLSHGEKALMGELLERVAAAN